MALLDKPIEVAFVADDSQIQDVMARVGRQSESMGRTVGKGSEAARLGLWSMGEAAENAAQSLGVPHQMSRQLGNSVERLSAGLGSLGIAFGVAGLAAMAAYAIWTQVNEAKKKQHEELEKNVEALLKEESALYRNKIETQELREANERLRDVKKNILEHNFVEWVRQEREEIAKLNKEIREGKGLFSELWEAIKMFGQSEEDIERQYWAERQKRRDDVAQKEAELAAQQAQRKANRINELNELNEAEKQRYYDYDAIMRAEADAQIRRMEEERRINQIRMQGYQVVAGNFASAFQMMASLGGKHARQWFTLYKLSAISEAIISTYAGAARALKDYPAPVSYAVAAAITAAGLAKVAVIRAQQFQGGGAGAGGAVGTFPVNPATGLPEAAGGGTAVNLTLVINGQTMNIGEITSGVAQELYRNNGSVGGFSIAVERSA
jgi:hypothetical protein